MQDIITTTTATDKTMPVQANTAESTAGGRSEVGAGRSFQQEFESQQAAASQTETVSEGQHNVDEHGNSLPLAENPDPSSAADDASALPSLPGELVQTSLSDDPTSVDPGWQAYFGSLATNETVQPGQPGQPVQSVQPGQPGQPGQPVQPGQPGQPVKQLEMTVRPAANAASLTSSEPLQQEPVDIPEQQVLRGTARDDTMMRGDLAANRLIPRTEPQQVNNTVLGEDAETAAVDRLVIKHSGAEGEQGAAGNKNGGFNTAMFSSALTTSARPSESAVAFNTVMTSATTSQISTAQSSATSVLQSSIPEAFGSTNWSQGLGKQLTMMVNQNIQTAELRMNPAHLGPIEVRIEMEDDQVNVAFSSRHAVVREAMEQALPRLREMLDQEGLNLGDSDISQQSFAEQQAADRGDAEAKDELLMSALSDEGNALPEQQNTHTSSLDSLVDYYI